MKSRNTSRIQFPVGSGTVGHVAWTLQPLICSRGNDSERGSTVPNVPIRIYSMWRAAIFSAMIALCDGDSGQKNNNHWPFWPPTPDKNMCTLRSFGRSQRPETMDNGQ